MEPVKTFQKMIDFQKSSFDMVYDMMAIHQDHAQCIMEMMLDHSPHAPAYRLEACNVLIEVYKQGCQSLKTAVDENYDLWSAYLKNESAPPF